MKLSMTSFSDVKTIYSDLFHSKTELSSMPLPGATCSVVAGATSCCTSCCFAS